MKCLADGVSFWGGIDARRTNVLCNAIWCELGFVVGGRLLSAAV